MRGHKEKPRNFANLDRARPAMLQYPRTNEREAPLMQAKAGREKRRELLRAVKFFLFSVSAGAVEMGSFALLSRLTPWPYWPCYLLALLLSVIWNFTFNRKFTFQSAANVPVAMLKVLAYYAVFTPLSTWLGHWLSDTLGWNEYLVTLLNMLLNFATEYPYQKFVVFAGSIDSKK